jgi:hypothetical protein
MGLNEPTASIHEECVAQAAFAVEMLKSIDGIDADYSRESLSKVDKVLLSMRSEGLKPESLEKITFMLGCYAGEVMRRHIRALGVPEGPSGEPRWLDPKTAGVEHMSGWPIIACPSGARWKPIGKAFKVVRAGEGESLASLFMAVSILASQNPQ